jgi:hypothetical protein
MSATKPAIWTRGDWNAFFGFGTNMLVNPSLSPVTLTEMLASIVFRFGFFPGGSKSKEP